MEKLPCKSIAIIPSDSGNKICELDVPFVPTPPEVIKKMLSIAHVHRNDTLYDLGCGDGRIVIAAAKNYGINSVGIDLDPRRIEECHHNAFKASVTDKVTFIHANLFDIDISAATVVSLYLLSNVNIRLRSKLFRELNSGSRIISHDFNMDKWSADKKVNFDDHVLFLWTIPANFSGIWHWKMDLPISTLNFSLQIVQHFQKISLNVNSPENVITKSIIISGKQIKLKLKLIKDDLAIPIVLTGLLNDNHIMGEYRAPGIFNKPWCAEREESSVVSIC